LTQAVESGYGRRDLPLSPLLSEYDAQGQLLWMSDRVSRGLAHLEGALLRQYFRLEKAERSLSSAWPARTAPPTKEHHDAGRRAQKQLELERQRLGRELHTGVGQTLSAMRIQLEVIGDQLPEPPEAVKLALDRLAALVYDAAEQVRSVSRRLHPPEWQRLNLQEAIRQLWEMSGIPQKYEASLRLEPLPQEPDLPVKILVYRAAQEALSNLVRHSKATRVDAVLDGENGKLRFTMSDNGAGFDVAALETAPVDLAAGIGLRSLREQAASLGGSMTMESGPLGTRMTILAPLVLED
jgi:signal transduction histidine kinase